MTIEKSSQNLLALSSTIAMLSFLKRTLVISRISIPPHQSAVLFNLFMLIARHHTGLIGRLLGSAAVPEVWRRQTRHVIVRCYDFRSYLHFE